MLYVHVNDSGVPDAVPIYEQELRGLLGHVILPSVITDDCLEGLNYRCLPYSEPPAPIDNHSLMLDIPTLEADGSLKRVFVQVPYSETEARVRWQELRDKRNKLLSETDWTQLSDIPDNIKAAWATYRQQLRDLPGVVTDPSKCLFPTKPNL